MFGDVQRMEGVERARRTDRETEGRKFLRFCRFLCLHPQNFSHREKFPSPLQREKFLTYLYCRRNLRVEICALLGHYATNNRNSLPKFRDNLSVLSSAVKKSKKKFGHTLVRGLYRGKCGSVIGCK
jgi:hypothetical protein